MNYVSVHQFDMGSSWYHFNLNAIGAEVGVFLANYVNIMADDVLVPSVARLSSAMFLLYALIYVFYLEEYLLFMPFWVDE